MDVGDLVRPQVRGHVGELVGIVLEVRHPRVTNPHYRTPTDILVYFPDEDTEWNERWFHKQELQQVIR